MEHRADIGLYVFELIDGLLKPSGNVFSYSDCVAVAALIKNGVSEQNAAHLVRERVVHAFPQHPSLPSEVAGGYEDVAAWTHAYFRLADGSLWDVNAKDFHTYCAEECSGDYLLVATRGDKISFEKVADRVEHLLTRCDEFGRPQLSTA